MSRTVPPGYEVVRVGSAIALCLPEIRSWVERALVDGTLYQRAARESRRTMVGRGPVHVVEIDGIERAVRHYHRGGAVAGVLEDRYARLGETRPFRELRVSAEARRRGVPTPRVAAGAIYRAGVFYRADLVTDYVPAATTLARRLADEADESSRRAALRVTGNLLRIMAEGGITHPDLNARNVLLTSSPGRPQPLLVDLDRGSASRDGRAVPPDRMEARLARSLRKWEKASGTRITAEEWAELRAAIQGSSGRGTGSRPGTVGSPE